MQLCLVSPTYILLTELLDKRGTACNEHINNEHNLKYMLSQIEFMYVHNYVLYNLKGFIQDANIPFHSLCMQFQL